MLKCLHKELKNHHVSWLNQRFLYFYGHVQVRKINPSMSRIHLWQILQETDAFLNMMVTMVTMMMMMMNDYTLR